MSGKQRKSRYLKITLDHPVETDIGKRNKEDIFEGSKKTECEFPELMFKNY
jgi:hypothetical protein